MPRRDWIVVIAVFTLVIVAWTIDSIREGGLFNSDVYLVATMVSKDIDPTLYPRDDLFADDTLYRFYTPVHRWLVAQVWQMSGSFEWGMVYLTPFILVIYLLGMFILLRRVTNNTWLALGLTVASANYYLVMGQDLWGVGGSHYMMARTVFAAIAPILFLWFLSLMEQPGILKGAALGFGIGLAANLHPISGWHFGLLVIGSVGLVHALGSGGWRNWLLVGVMALTVGLGALPITRSIRGGVTSSAGADLSSEVSFSTFSQIIHERYTMPFRPAQVEWELLGLELKQPVLDWLVWGYIGLVVAAFIVFLWGRHRWPGLVRWGWLVGGLLVIWYAYLLTLFNQIIFFVLIAGYVIYCFRRGPIRPLAWWLILWLGLTILISFVAYYFLTLAWETFELKLPFVLLSGQVRAARFIYLPLYLLVGLAGHTWVKVWAKELEKIWHRFGLTGQSPRETSLFVVIGVVLCLGPGLSREFFRAVPSALITSLVIIIGVVLVAWVLESLLARGLGRWMMVLGLSVLILLLFGPLASIFSPYLPIPAINSFNAAARKPESIQAQNDAELYQWVQQNTERDALFYWCDFGPITMLNFRRYGQRSINLTWKGLNLAAPNVTNLNFFYTRYRQLEAACQKFDNVVSMAHALEADYILIPAGRAVGLEGESCFNNDRYALFPVGRDCATEGSQQKR